MHSIRAEEQITGFQVLFQCLVVDVHDHLWLDPTMHGKLPTLETDRDGVQDTIETFLTKRALIPRRIHSFTFDIPGHGWFLFTDSGFGDHMVGGVGVEFGGHDGAQHLVLQVIDA
jgi:hypothetical protein